MSTTRAKPTLTKPRPNLEAARKALAFAEGSSQQETKGEEAKTTRLNANIPIELHKALKIRAANEGTTIGALIEDWIKSWAR